MIGRNDERRFAAILWIRLYELPQLPNEAIRAMSRFEISFIAPVMGKVVCLAIRNVQKTGPVLLEIF